MSVLLLMPLTTVAAEDGCIVSGCSGELCVSEGNNVASICIYRQEFACYKAHGTCKRQSDGNCGWTQTKALQECVEKAKAEPAKTPMAPVAQ